MIYEIDPSKKYIITTSMNLPPDEMQRGNEIFEELFNNPEKKFVFMRGDQINIVKLSFIDRLRFLLFGRV